MFGGKMSKIKDVLRKTKKFLKRLLRNMDYLLRYDLREREEEQIYKLTDKIIDDCVYELDEDKALLPNLKILDESESIELLLQKPKSFCRYGDGEIKLMQGISQAFQVYDEELAQKLRNTLSAKHEDMYIGINRAYFHSPINCSEENRRFYRIYSREYRQFFLKICNPRNVYIDAGFLTAYYRFDDSYDFKSHYEKMLRLFDGKKIALVSGDGVVEKLEYDVFERAKEKMVIHGPSKNAYARHDEILNEICTKVPKDYLICLILGMTAKVLVPELTEIGYVAWDVGHLAKDYNAYMKGEQKCQKNISNFWAPD